MGVSLANFLGVFAMITAFLFIATGLLYWLWNITIPQVFDLKEITFWQAFRILIIAGLLFGGPGFIS